MTAPRHAYSVAARPSCTVRRMDALYRIPESRLGARARLDRVLTIALDDLLDAAMERAGVPLSEETCVRVVHIVARLRLDVPDSELSLAWSLAAADAIAREIREGGANVVRYGSRQHALVDLAVSASRGDVTRAWAWRQLGLWQDGDNSSRAALATAALDALSREAHSAAAVLAEVARRDGLASLIALAPNESWTALECAVLGVAGIDARELDMLETALEMGVDTALEASVDDGGSSSGEADVAHRDWFPELDTTDRRASARAIARAIERILRHSRIATAAVACTPLSLEKARALATLAILEAAPDLTMTDAAHLAAVRAGVRVPSLAPLAPVAAARATVRDDEAAPPDVRQGAVTRSGGVLFLLHIVRDVELPQQIVADPALAARGLAWSLHRLAVALARVDETDPAALAFCGRRPSDDAPSRDEPPASFAEQAAIDAYCSVVIAALRTRLPVSDEWESDEALMATVVRRRAEIVADPAWIEARFALEEVSVPIRRVGLDLNLDWLPWLGVVMRFVYV
jgi:hypothetical protein